MAIQYKDNGDIHWNIGRNARNERHGWYEMYYLMTDDIIRKGFFNDGQPRGFHRVHKNHIINRF